jgi:replicative DNA helicase
MGNVHHLPVGRVPPHNLEAEAAVLSASMLDAAALDEVVPMLRVEHFYSQANGTIWEAITSLYGEGKSVDVVAVAAWLRDRQRIQRIGGARYLGNIVDATPAVAHIHEHAAVVLDKWRLRELIRTCQKYAAEGYGDVGETKGFIQSAERDISVISRSGYAQTTVKLNDAITTTFQQIAAAAESGRVSGTPTGFTDLDRLICGLHDGDVLVLAARPGQGKTSLAQNIAVNVAMGQQGVPGRAVAFFSLEMPKEQLSLRMVCAEARVDIQKIRRGELSTEEWVNLTDAAAVLAPLPIWIDDDPKLTMLDQYAKARTIRRQAEQVGFELGLVVLDYLQLMSRDRGHSTEDEVAQLSRGQKILAKDLGVPVIAISQLNRKCEERGKDKRPVLADLRSSGAIEQDADGVVFIYRDEFYHPDTTEARGLAELILAKQRNGPTGKAMVRYSGYCTRFDNLAHGEYEESEYGY